MKRIAILGATGSIGTTALSVLRTRTDLPVKVVSLSAHTSRNRLLALSKEFNADAVCFTGDRQDGFFHGYEGLKAMLEEHPVDIVLNGIAGFDGLKASVAALEAGADLALANKESVVSGGPLLFELAERHHAAIIPVDSEHSAIFELLKGRAKEEISSLILTASGGPFRNRDLSTFASITVGDALAHPTWRMGRKISVDSATMANKALEVIEASYLFGFRGDEIEVVIHPQSIVHSMIRTRDGAVYAQLGNPDMSLPIINALTSMSSDLAPPLDFTRLTLTFEGVDERRFPLLRCGYDALENRGGYPLAFNAANEVAVEAFLSERITYPRLIDIVRKTMELDWSATPASVEEIIALDREVRSNAEELL
ncbi:MAG: 1-deoxy-D-xylulose-5-phosphate reductoisomerase [Spirochaetales bacterium]|nr:1-deoxy-D-xylulose-5-phosphate reductoisomerase [Spirochaetales bacterium]